MTTEHCAELVLAFLRRADADPRRSARFVPKGAARAGYATKEKKARVTFTSEREGKSGLEGTFDAGGGDLPGVPMNASELGIDPFIHRGDLLAVSLLHEDGTTRTAFIDIDNSQMENGALPRVTAALDKANISYLLERSCSGTGVHVWVFLCRRVNGAKAREYLLQVLGNAGLKAKKGGRNPQPNDFDQIKPFDGDGGWVIVPHGLSDGASSFIELKDTEVVPIPNDAAIHLLDEFLQRDSLCGEIEALTEAAPRRQRGRKAKKPTQSHPELGTLSARELADEVFRIEWINRTNEKLKKQAKKASSAKKGDRSEAAYAVLCCLILDHGCHPDAVIDYCRNWPKYQETSLEEEVSRIVSKASDGILRGRLGYWHRSGAKFPSASESNGLVECVDQLSRNLKDSIETADRTLRIHIVAIPPGVGKSTIAIPVVAERITNGFKHAGRCSVVVRKERRDDCVLATMQLNAFDQNITTSATDQFADSRSHLPLVGPDHYLNPPTRHPLDGQKLSGFGTPKDSYLNATYQVSFYGRERCPKANGDREAEKAFESLVATAKATRSTPCASGCDFVRCPQHPAHLKILQNNSAVPPVVVVTHASAINVEADVALIDERPEVIVTHRLTIERSAGRHWKVEPLDSIRELLVDIGQTDMAATLGDARRKLVDAAEQLLEKPDDTRFKQAPTCGWSSEDLEALFKSFDGRREAVANAVERASVQISREGFWPELKKSIKSLAYLLDGKDAVWLWQKGTLTLAKASNGWLNLIQQGKHGCVVFDGTAGGHYEYAGVPKDVEMVWYGTAPIRYPNVTFVFDKSRLTKGRGSTRVPQQTAYALASLRDLMSKGYKGDVLVVTQQSAVRSIKQAIRGAADVMAGFSLAEDCKSGGRPRIFLQYFGNLKGSNEYRSAKAVVITHQHNLSVVDATAKAHVLFPGMRITDPETGTERSLPRKWSPLCRRKGQPGLFDAQFRRSHVPEIQYVMQSHLASETGQAIMRSAVRDDPTASIVVYYPLGSDTELGVQLLRQFAGATTAASDLVEPDSKDVSERGAVAVPNGGDPSNDSPAAINREKLAGYCGEVRQFVRKAIMDRFAVERLTESHYGTYYDVVNEVCAHIEIQELGRMAKEVNGEGDSFEQVSPKRAAEWFLTRFAPSYEDLRLRAIQERRADMARSLISN